VTTPVEDPQAQHPYEMTLSLSVLEHLGLNLYSNIPAVISEVVANSWDADAGLVTIDVDTAAQTITVADDGDGMTRTDVNARFLHVGYRRRAQQPTTTKKQRHVMGRKGIGKLSLFAIADNVTVLTTRDGERNGFVLRTAAIREAMTSGEGSYHPKAIPPDQVEIGEGTKIELTELKLKATAGTIRFLRRRLARRFSVLGPQHGFVVRVNGEDVGVADREYFPAIEYLWTIGAGGAKYKALCPNLKRDAGLSGDVDADKGWRISGWVGTVDEQKRMPEDANVLPVLAWGKVAHEDLLADINPAGVFAKYIVGEIHADFVDADDADDIATSDRQRLKETDPRFEALRRHVEEQILRPIGNRWRDWRNEDALGRPVRTRSSRSGTPHWGQTLASTQNASSERSASSRLRTVPARRSSTSTASWPSNDCGSATC
jgi:hypothetical protein